MKKFIIKNAIIIGGVLLLVRVVFDSFFDFNFGFVNKQETVPFDIVGDSISNNVAKLYADVFHTAMASVGTDFDLIYSTFKRLNNEVDYLKVHNAFSDRGYIDVLGVGVDIAYPKMLNLTQWLISELSHSERSKLSLLCPYLTF